MEEEEITGDELECNDDSCSLNNEEEDQEEDITDGDNDVPDDKREPVKPSKRPVKSSEKVTDAFRKTIEDYLIKRALIDPLFAETYKKPNKNLDECISYILSTVKDSKINGFTDDEIYNMAIHYYDEDNLKVNKFPINMQVVVNHHIELTEAEKDAAKKKAIDELIEKKKKEMTNRKSRGRGESKADEAKLQDIIGGEIKSEPKKIQIIEQTLF